MADVARSSRREVRNPVLALPEAQAILAMPSDQRAAWAILFAALSKACAEKAQHCWRTHKPPMAVYWKAVGVVANHCARMLRHG